MGERGKRGFKKLGAIHRGGTSQRIEGKHRKKKTLRISPFLGPRNFKGFHTRGEVGRGGMAVQNEGRQKINRKNIQKCHRKKKEACGA